MNTAIYACLMPIVSQSLSKQIKVCQAIAHKKNLVVPRSYIITDPEPILDGFHGMGRLLTECEKGTIKTVVVDDLTTLCGSIYFMHQLLDQLAEDGIRIISVNDDLDWAPSESKDLADQWLKFIGSTKESGEFFMNPSLPAERALFRSGNLSGVPERSMHIWKKIDRRQQTLQERILVINWKVISE